MNSKFVLMSLAAVACLVHLGEATLDSKAQSTILQQLSRMPFGAYDSLSKRCQTYERHLRTHHKDALAGELKLFSLTQEVGQSQAELSPAESQILVTLQRCLDETPLGRARPQVSSNNNVSPAKSDELHTPEPLNNQVPPPTTEETPQQLVRFGSVDLAKLSQVRYELKSLPLDKRCQGFENTIREILETTQPELAHASKPQLFKAVIQTLASRRVPFQEGKQPLVEPLSECVDNLSAYQVESVPERTVVAGPNYPRGPQKQEADPISNIRREFNDVKNRVVDHGQDLYAPRQELNYHGYDSSHDPSNGEIELEIDDDVPPPSPRHLDNGGLYNFPEEERYRPSTDDALNEHRQMTNDFILDETLEELIRRERDPKKKVELELQFEKRRNQKLLQQLDDNQYEIGELKEHVDKLKASVESQQQLQRYPANKIEESRLAEMRLLYEQACEREERQKERYEMLARKYADLEARQVLERSFDDAHEDDEDDDDDEEGDDHHESEKVKNKKDKKDKKKDKKDKKKEKDEKIYKSPVDIARKLQDRMNSSELPEHRCQKYYMLLNHPGKVTKKVLKTVAKLRLPKALNQDPEYYSSLTYYAELLSKAEHENARRASEELKQCLVNRFAANNDAGDNQGALRQDVELDQSDDSVPASAYLDHFAPSPLNRQPSGKFYSNLDRPRWFQREDSLRRPPSSDVREIPVEFVNSNKRDNKFAYAGGPNSVAAATIGSYGTLPNRFRPNKLADFQAQYY